jgi:hypothetical protein
MRQIWVQHRAVLRLGTKTFTDPRICAAIVDRLTFAGTIIETGTVRYRLALRPGAADRDH